MAKRTSTSLRERPSSFPRRSAILASSSGTRRVVRGPRCFGARVRAVRTCRAIFAIIAHQIDACRSGESSARAAHLSHIRLASYWPISCQFTPTPLTFGDLPAPGSAAERSAAMVVPHKGFCR
jgi:hypothetical protein